tara:strand:- start:1232 stop:1444 length:213 start_codon:yes stop_codon:yes gene_type:complete
MPVLKIPLDYSEKRILDELAANDLRQPVQVMRWLLRSEGMRRGILADAKQHETATGALHDTGGGFVEVNP